MSKRGRNRMPGERYPSGQIKPTGPQLPVTPEVLRQRAALLGIDPVRLITMSEAVAKVLRDDKAGTALGRLTWRFETNGDRQRRQGVFDGLMALWITDDMVDAAEAYRALWVHWHRLIGFPRRHPQGQQFDRKGKHYEGIKDYGCERESNASCRCEVCRTTERLKIAEYALMGCRQNRLVQAVVEAVVIEDVAPEGLVLGERSAAVAALRRGLDALHEVLCSGRRRAA